MKNPHPLIPSLFVFTGACFYGFLATMVKLCYDLGYSTYQVTMVQYSTGLLIMLVLTLLTKNLIWNRASATLLLAGTTLGFTGIFYYLSLTSSSVSTAIILLMQSTWMGVLWDSIAERKRPSSKLLGVVLLIWVGTYLTAGAQIIANLQGLIYGLIAAISYSITIKFSGFGKEIHTPISRSFTMLLGGFLVIAAAYFWTYSPSPIHNELNFDPYFLLLGTLLGICGTVLAPLLFSYGMPALPLSKATLLSSAELPVSVLSAYWLLGEGLSISQIIGIGLIIIGIIYIPTIR